MKIGILSDSHGQVKRLQTAVQTLRAAGAQVLVHCGDLGSVECLAVLASAGLPCYAVVGNMDRHVDRLADAAVQQGVGFDRRMVTVALGDGRTLAVTHGHDAGLLRQLVSSGQHAYVCFGHAHKFSDKRSDDVRVINPGALHHAYPYTVAVLDTDTDALEALAV